jgi:hypothetical protein
MKPHANEVRSKFLEGMDTAQISKHFGITESEAVELLQEARRAKFQINPPSRKSLMRGAYKGGRSAAVSKRNVSVSLAPLKFLQEAK